MSEVVKMVPHYNEECVVCFDVDETLLKFKDGVLLKHEEHIESLKLYWYRGHHVIVWSAGGKKWAEYIVKRLELQSFVHEVMSKPKWYYDDKPADSWMERVYLRKEGFNAGRTIGSLEEITGDNETSSTIYIDSDRVNRVVYPIPTFESYGSESSGYTDENRSGAV